jgi:ATP phosphoribosyltransferase
VSSSEIAQFLKTGSAHLGITGEDLIRETIADADQRVEFLQACGFGRADVVVAVPACWLDVRRLSDLEEMALAYRRTHGRQVRVATKYMNMARRFFTRHGVTGYRIVESLGATEGAPAAGLAELIVDITTTGATLSANALKVIDDGVILRSQANLVAARAAPWGESERATARLLLDRLAAEARGRAFREVRARLVDNNDAALAEAQKRFGLEVPFGSATSSGMVTLHCPPGEVHALASFLRQNGAEAVTVADLGYVFARDNPLYARLEAGLAG